MRNINWLVQKIFYMHKSISLHDLKADHSASLYYDVPFIQQEHANMCLDASENMLNVFFKQPLHQLSKNTRGILEGKENLQSDLREELLDVDNLKSLLDSKGPLILELPMSYGFSHMVTCVGYSKDHIIYHDPLTEGNRCISLAELKRITADRQNSDDVLSVAWSENPAKVDVKSQQRQPTQHEQQKVFKTHSRQSSFFNRAAESKPQWIQAVANFMDSYANGKTFLHPVRKGSEAIKKCAQLIRNMAAPEQVMAVIRRELGRFSKQSQQKRAETSIRQG